VNVDPEDVQLHIDRYDELVRLPVAAYGGEVPVGDGLLVVFVSPTLREEDAGRRSARHESGGRTSRLWRGLAVMPVSSSGV